jgi:hypothetical protein
MNKQLVITLLILGFPLTTYALKPQQGDSGLHATNIRIERDQMEKELDRNEVTKAKVEAIINEETMRLKAFKKNNPSVRRSYTKTNG